MIRIESSSCFFAFHVHDPFGLATDQQKGRAGFFTMDVMTWDVPDVLGIRSQVFGVRCYRGDRSMKGLRLTNHVDVVHLMDIMDAIDRSRFDHGLIQYTVSVSLYRTYDTLQYDAQSIRLHGSWRC